MKIMWTLEGKYLIYPVSSQLESTTVTAIFTGRSGNLSTTGAVTLPSFTSSFHYDRWHGPPPTTVGTGVSPFSPVSLLTDVGISAKSVEAARMLAIADITLPVGVTTTVTVTTILSSVTSFALATTF